MELLYIDDIFFFYFPLFLGRADEIVMMSDRFEML